MAEYKSRFVKGRLSLSELGQWLRCAGVPHTTQQRLALTLTPGQAFVVWLGELFSRRHPIADEHQECLLEHFCEKLGEIAADFEQDSNFQPLLVIVDNTFVCLSGDTRYFDLRHGVELEAIPSPPVEVVSYNLRKIFTQAKLRYQQEESLCGSVKEPKSS